MPPPSIDAEEPQGLLDDDLGMALQLVLEQHQQLAARKGLQIALELAAVEPALDVQVVLPQRPWPAKSSRTRALDRPGLDALADLVQVVRMEPLDRLAQHHDDARVGRALGDPRAASSDHKYEVLASPR